MSWIRRHRELCSLVIFLHFFCLLAGLFAQETTSELGVRLGNVLGPYLRLVNIDAQAPAGFHLTHAMEYEDNHQLVVQLDGDPNEQA